MLRRPSLLTSLLQRLVRRRAPKPAAVLLSALRLLGLEVNIIHQNCVICAAERSGNWRLATDFLGSAARQRVSPDEISYNTVLSAQESSWKAAKATLEALQSSSCEASATSYNCLLSACEKCSSWNEALSVLSQMIGLSVALDAFSESAGIATLNKAKRWEEALLRFGVADVGARSVVTFGAALTACERGRQWLSALQLLTKMPATSLQGNVVTYSAALAACADAVQWHAACQLFWDMASASVEANTVVFGAATGAFAAADWKLAISMLSTMVKEAVRINTVVLLAVLDACASAGKTDTIIALSTEMADAGVTIDSETCSAIVAACESRQPRRAAMLLDTAGKDGLQQLQGSGR